MSDVSPAIDRLRRIAPVAIVVVVAAACGDNNKSTAPPTRYATTTLNAPAKAPPTVPTGAAGKGTLVVGTRNLLPLLKGSIRRFAPTQAEAKSLRVIALAGPDGLWAGRSDAERILVKMRLKGGSPPKITIGQKVDFIGLLTSSPGDAGSLGVSNGADRALLAKQGAYVDASVADVALY